LGLGETIEEIKSRDKTSIFYHLQPIRKERENKDFVLTREI
jgi:hypothetical protein